MHTLTIYLAQPAKVLGVCIFHANSGCVFTQAYVLGEDNAISSESPTQIFSGSEKQEEFLKQEVRGQIIRLHFPVSAIQGSHGYPGLRHVGLFGSVLSSGDSESAQGAAGKQPKKGRK